MIKIAEKALEKMGLTDCTPFFHQVSENTTYIIKRNNIPVYTLRISRKGYRTLSQLEAELSWLRTIKGVKYARPVSGVLDIGGYFCVFFEFIEGKMPEYNDKTALYNIGKIAAKLHSFADISLDRPVWNTENMTGEKGLWGDWRENPELTDSDISAIKKALDMAKNNIESYNSRRYGLIHADLRITNIIENNSYYAIDFDDCGYGYFIQDLASALSFMEGSDNIEDLKNAWFSGYEEISHLDNKDKEIADSFILLRRIQLLAWVTSHGDSEYVRSIRQGFGKDSVNVAMDFMNKYK